MSDSIFTIRALISDISALSSVRSALLSALSSDRSAFMSALKSVRSAFMSDRNPPYSAMTAMNSAAMTASVVSINQIMAIWMFSSLKSFFVSSCISLPSHRACGPVGKFRPS